MRSHTPRISSRSLRRIRGERSRISRIRSGITKHGVAKTITAVGAGGALTVIAQRRLANSDLGMKLADLGGKSGDTTTAPNGSKPTRTPASASDTTVPSITG